MLFIVVPRWFKATPFLSLYFFSFYIGKGPIYNKEIDALRFALKSLGFFRFSFRIWRGFGLGTSQYN
jgi:hypothetical protein